MGHQRLGWVIAFLCLAPILQAATSQDYYISGFDYYTQKDYAKSIPYLKAAVQLDPQDWKAYQILGYDYYLSNQSAEALEAFDQSLRWHPENPQLWDWAESIRARIIWEAERNDPYPRLFRNIQDYPIWVGLHAGFITANLGDLPKAASAFQSYYGPQNGQASATADGFGPLGGLEVGFMLDTYDAWGVVFDYAPLNGYNASTQDNFGNIVKEKIQPNMISIQAEYYRYFKLGSTRLWANAGAGFYTTLVELDESQNGIELQSGELGGDGYGGFLGAGWEIAVAEQFSASVNFRGRYATTGNIQGMVLYNNGADQPSVLASDSTGVVSAWPTGTPGINPINIDFTGIDMGFSLSYRY